MTSFAPPGTQFYLTEWCPFWLDLEPRCSDIVKWLHAIPTLPWTTHDSIRAVRYWLDQANGRGFNYSARPTGTALIAVDDGEPVRWDDSWLDGLKQVALAAVAGALKEHPPSMAKIQEMRSRIAKVDGGKFRMVQILFIGLRKNAKAAIFGAAVDGSFVIRELGHLPVPPGSGLILERGQSGHRTQIMFWSDEALMLDVDSFSRAGYELIGTPMVILCPDMPVDHGERTRWAERFVDDGLGLYVTGSAT